MDDRLSYHTFLASDLALASTDFLENRSLLRPDLNIFNIAWTFSEDLHNPHASFSLVEFKRPERDDYSDGENPIDQVLKQVREIRAGTVRNPATGQLIEINLDAPAYTYIVRILTKKLRDWADLFSLRETPDQQGYFGIRNTTRISRSFPLRSS